LSDLEGLTRRLIQKGKSDEEILKRLVQEKKINPIEFENKKHFIRLYIDVFLRRGHAPYMNTYFTLKNNSDFDLIDFSMIFIFDFDINGLEGFNNDLSGYDEENDIIYQYDNSEVYAGFSTISRSTNYESCLTRDFKFEITEFCKHYNVKKLRIDFYVDRLLSSDLGLYMFSRGEDKFFFHREDVLGVTTIRLIKDNLINEIIEVSLAEEKMISDLDLDRLAEEITEKLLGMELIWDMNESRGISGIKEPFEMLVEKMIIKYALEISIPKTSLMDIALQSKKLLKAEGGKNSLYNIINNSERYEDLNLVSISDSEETELFQSLKLLQGFCRKCGKTVLKNDLSNICIRCGLNFQGSGLLKDIETASELSVAYKIASLEEEKELECPNPNCNYLIKLNWDVCPNCLTPIIKP